MAKAPAKPKRKALKDMDLDELYDREKITDAVFKHILVKQDFSQVSRRYCESACKMPCHMKNPSGAFMDHGEVDIMIIQDTYPLDEKYKSSREVYQLHLRQIAFMASRAFRGMSHRVHTLAKCRPQHWVEGGRVKKLTYTNISRCAPYLWEEIARVNPKVIISTSTEVTKSLGLKISNYNQRGHFGVTDIAYIGKRIPVVATLHPRVLNMIRQNASGAMYGPDFLSVIERDFAKAAAIAAGDILLQDVRKVVERVARDQIAICRSIHDVKRWVKVLMDQPVKSIMSWDTETNNLDPWADDARILTHQFGYRREDGKVQAVVFPMWHEKNKFYDPDEAWMYVRQVLEGPHMKVGHNLKFDTVFTRVTSDVVLNNCCLDTMLMLHSINSGVQGNYSLKTAVWDRLPQSGLGGYEDLLYDSLPDEE